jgi:hypothetical protein
MGLFHNYATKQAAPPSVIRTREYDYSHLSETDRKSVDDILEGERLTPNAVVETFIRRHHVTYIVNFEAK